MRRVCTPQGYQPSSGSVGLGLPVQLTPLEPYTLILILLRSTLYQWFEAWPLQFVLLMGQGFEGRWGDVECLWWRVSSGIVVRMRLARDTLGWHLLVQYWTPGITFPSLFCWFR